MIPFFEQFARPRGRLGLFAGWALAFHNRQANRRALSALEPITGQRVLELGFGPGWALQRLLARGASHVTGVEVSEVMIASASRRLKSEIAARRATLIDGDVTSLELSDASVTRALAVYSAMFWPDQPRAFSELSRVLAPGGILALEVRVQGTTALTRDSGLETAADATARYLGLLQGANFEAVTFGLVHERMISDTLWLRAVRR